MSDRAWEFWIDVGGTFTDCLARDPSGRIRVHKLLSSGVYRGRVESGSTANVVRCNDRRGDPDRFFEGYSLTLLGDDGQPLGSAVLVSRFDRDAGVLALAEPLAHPPRVGMRYELTSGEEAPVVGVRWLMGRRLDEPIGAVAVRLGTTRGTNALLERKGAKVALVTTAGFGDALRIGYQNRPKLFELAIRKPDDLYAESVEIAERVDCKGAILEPIDLAAAQSALAAAQSRGVESLAICLLNAYVNGEHEDALAAVARELGFKSISVSSRLARLQRLVDRGDTTVVDAYLTPILRDYVSAIRDRMPDASIKLMTSAGSLVDAETFVGKDSVLSGPAGGVVGVARVAKAAGFDRAIGFDMGGTSTDVCRYAGEFERRYVMEVKDPRTGAGVRIFAPMLAIETVAAGGGSICRFDGQKTVVGPESAGSNPGPACYGRGGPLCVTDLNLFLGRLLPERFALPLDLAAARRRLVEVAATIEEVTGAAYKLEELAAGFLAIANANMAAAIKSVSLARGYDVRDHALVSFGGAGAQHACAIARELGIRAVLCHPHAGVLSAFGIGMADITRFDSRHVGRPLSAETLSQLAPAFDEIAKRLAEEVAREGVTPDRIMPPRRILDLRYQGQDSAISVVEPDDGDYRAAFEQRHQQHYGFHFPDRTVEILACRVEVTGETRKPEPAVRAASGRPVEPIDRTRVYWNGEWRDAAVYDRGSLGAADKVPGPAIIVEPTSTIVVEPGWIAEMTAGADLVLRDEGTRDAQGDQRQAATADPIQLELFNNQFASIAERMGLTLQRTALSTNVKERLDYSCALFNRAGELVVNAPHIPVHLGAMGETVRRIIADEPTMNPGDVFITNDPFAGGSHLPDVTVVTPVFDRQGREILFFTASRAHHAEIGGIVPGSMPPFSTSLAEEGVLIRRFRLVTAAKSSEAALRRLLEDAPYPSRSVDENIADINAQVAANQTGAELLRELVDRHGSGVIAAYMTHIQLAAERKTRVALAKLPEGERLFVDYLDNGLAIAVAIRIKAGRDGAEAEVDFTGSGPVSADNLNANPAIVRATVLYVFRALLAEDIPLNDGVLAPVRIIVPPGTLLHPPADADPRRCPAVGGGNVETSQRVVDALLGALGLAAASQGTMNNFLFGRAASQGKPGFGYYETIGGGAGAGPGFPGASGVHTHMTNTRITDAEVFEARYPARLVRFSLRPGSGGEGRYRGGDGLIREVLFLDDLDVSLVTNRRSRSPYGLAGGKPGSRGRNLLYRLGGDAPEELPSSAQLKVRAGERLRLETPGGGGYGEPETG